jgi:hypothetical protein
MEPTRTPAFAPAGGLPPREMLSLLRPRASIGAWFAAVAP